MNSDLIKRASRMCLIIGEDDWEDTPLVLRGLLDRIADLETDRDAWVVKAEETLVLLQKANDQCEGWAATATRQTEVISDLRTKAERIAELEAALLVRLDRKVLNDTWKIRAEKVESAVKRLAEALKEAWHEGYHDGIGDGHPLSSGGHRWKDSEAVEALDDPIVKSILEGT